MLGKWGRAGKMGKMGSECILHSVEQWLRGNGVNIKYFKVRPVPPLGSAEWKTNVDAAELLADLFEELRLGSYDKVKHSYELTKLILNSHPEEFDELKALLAPLIPAD